MALQDFSFKVKHWDGRNQKNVDALSRIYYLVAVVRTLGFKHGEGCVINRQTVLVSCGLSVSGAKNFFFFLGKWVAVEA